MPLDLAAIYGEFAAKSVWEEFQADRGPLGNPLRSDLHTWDRDLSLLFEGTARIDAAAAAVRVGAASSLPDPTFAGALLRWGCEASIIALDADRSWFRLRAGPTFIPQRGGESRDIRHQVRTGPISLQGLISRENKLRNRLRARKLETTVSLLSAELDKLADDVVMPSDLLDVPVQITAEQMRVTAPGFVRSMQVWKGVELVWKVRAFVDASDRWNGRHDGRDAAAIGGLQSTSLF